MLLQSVCEIVDDTHDKPKRLQPSLIAETTQRLSGEAANTCNQPSHLQNDAETQRDAETSIAVQRSQHLPPRTCCKHMRQHHSGIPGSRSDLGHLLVGRHEDSTIVVCCRQCFAATWSAASCDCTRLLCIFQCFIGHPEPSVPSATHIAPASDTFPQTLLTLLVPQEIVHGHLLRTLNPRELNSLSLMGGGSSLLFIRVMVARCQWCWCLSFLATMTL